MEVNFLIATGSSLSRKGSEDFIGLVQRAQIQSRFTKVQAKNSSVCRTAWLSVPSSTPGLLSYKVLRIRT